MSRFNPLIFCALVCACSGGAGPDDPPSGGDDAGDTPTADGGPGTPDAGDPITESCNPAFIGGGDGCDCGCGVTDPDCPVGFDVGDCKFDNCVAGTELDPSDPTQCLPIALPAGWTCSAFAYGGDGVCSCGCGAMDDKDCPADLEVTDCTSVEHGCPTGMWPDPANPTGCGPAKAGWTCNWGSYYDSSCACGCGAVDPKCPANMHVSQCGSDGCPSGQSPNPQNLTQCMSNAPQDDWTCPLALLDDGVNCDCGCGAIDLDCPAGATASSCDAVHCGTADELKPGNIGECWEICKPLTVTVGNATCTNGGFVNIFNSCERSLSACSDGRTYQVECEAGQCVCRVNGKCVKHATGSCSLNFTCGWNLIDAT